jgi:putative DNA primase/helicase
VWDGARYRFDETGAVFQLAKETARSIREEAMNQATDKAKKTFDWALASENNNRLNAMLNAARTEPGMSITPDLWDSEPWLLNVLNGTIELRTGILREHRKQDHITALAPFEYYPDAACPAWLSFLNRAFAGDEQMIGFVQRFFGYALTGDVSRQICPLFVGGGANGKSTLVDTVLYVMADYGDVAPPGLLMQRTMDEHPTELADLKGKRLVIASENERGRKLRTQFIKQVTGDATLKARFMHADYFSFRQTAKVVLVTNNLPKIDEDSEAVWRRLPVVRFPVVIPAGERDPDLLAKLKREVSGILGWMLEGCLLFQRFGLDPPSKVKSATAAYRRDSDRFGRFFEDYCVLGEQFWTRTPEITDAYLNYSLLKGEQPGSLHELHEALRRKECSPQNTNKGRGWKGLRLKTRASDTSREEGSQHHDVP